MPHQTAIQRLGFGGQDHLVLHFESRFWDDCYILNVIAESDPTKAVEFFLPFPAHCPPVIVAFIPYKAALQWCSKPEGEIVDAALAALRRSYGDKVTKLVEAKYSAWFSNPNFLGGYSYLSTVSSPADFDALAEPIHEGKLFIAGEASSREHFSTAHGGYISGTAAAQRVLRNEQQLSSGVVLDQTSSTKRRGVKVATADSIMISSNNTKL